MKGPGSRGDEVGHKWEELGLGRCGGVLFEEMLIPTRKGVCDQQAVHYNYRNGHD